MDSSNIICLFRQYRCNYMCKRKGERVGDSAHVHVYNIYKELIHRRAHPLTSPMLLRTSSLMAYFSFIRR